MSSPKPADAMQINRWTLCYRGRHAHLEKAFVEHTYHDHIKTIRTGLVIGIFILAFFGIYDTLLVPNKYHLIWLIRGGIFCHCMFWFFLFTYSRHFERFMELSQVVMIFIGGICLIAMILIAQTENVFSYTNGLVQVMFFIHAFIRLRFKWRTPTTWFILVIYFSLAIGTGITPQQIITADIFNLSCINMIGMMASYIIEFRIRRNFYLSRQLESKKRRLSAANQHLERRVARRTADLSKTNQLLKEEIHERKAAESALRKSEKRFRSMVDNVTDHMCVHDLKGNILDANQQMINGLGFSQSELSQMNYNSLLVPEERFDFEYYLTNIRREGRALGKMTLLTKTGGKHRFEYSNVLAEHTSGQQVVYSLARDITQDQRAAKALAESQASFRSIFETSAAGMMIVNAHTREVVEINPATADMVGAKIDSIKGMPIEKLIDVNQQGADGAIEITTSHPIECELITQKQTRIPILKTTKTTAINETAHWIISIVNMQKIKEAEEAKRTVEERLQQAQHLQSIGTLAGGIAHDFNNILFGMLGFTELALDDAPKDSLQAANLKEALQGGQRAKEMINQILIFSRQDQAEKHPLQPMPLIKEALKLLRASIPTSIEIETQFGDKLNWIDANPTQIHQVIMNLCTNAAHAMTPEGGCLGMELANETYTEEKVTSHGNISEGKHVRISVSDTGTGISPEVVRRIFEPFFTTKPQGEGTGMGLSVALGIVQAHGGTIKVHSHPGKGSRFDVLLPAISPGEKSQRVDQLPPPKGNEHIMFVDDEKPLTIMMERMLSNLGYKVTTCEQPLQALELVKSKPHHFDLVITDLTMPKMAGTHLARELLKIRPELPIVLCTGYGEQITKENIHALGICKLLIKPVRKANIASAIRQALDAGAHNSSMAKTG